MPADHPAAKPGEEVDLSGIAKAEGGKTVAEVFAEKDALAGKPVTVRGKVVKVNAGIMGKNWLHVRDGSGAEGTNDLTVTTAAELPALGATVVVIGPVTLNKDFGMGYAVRRDRRGRRGQGGISAGSTSDSPVAGETGRRKKERPGRCPAFFMVAV